ncbi:MAG TPA: Holliday junction branch migration protein RuvA [Clostridiales bacterium]|nr:MAG: Holliday junction DNA helicase RuvA [Clostridiales bacterium GWD2_32_19]HCC08131.1 Holliday junction branch migration protein RuvA [Clostridiales bacterium]
MISYVRGILTEKEINYAIVDVGGVGYRVYIPVLDYSNLPQINEEVKIHTYLYVKEDIMKLYGSLEKKTMNIFEMLISVSGIGPKVAIGMLSAMYFENIVKAIIEEDADALSKCPGIGKKTAQKVILELKDKFKNYQVIQQVCNLTNNFCTSINCEAIEALQCLGYSKKVADDIVTKVTKDKDNTNLADIVKSALKELAK